MTTLMVFYAGVCSRAATGDAVLVSLAANRFQRLTYAELQLLRYADVGNQRRGEWAVCGSSAEPKDPSNDPSQSASWPVQRNIRAELIRWLVVDRAAVVRIDPNGIRILGGRIVGKLNLSNVHVPFAITMIRCRLDDVNLTSAEIQSLDLAGSYISSFYAEYLVAHGPVFLGWDGTKRGGDFYSAGKVFLPDAKIEGELAFNGGKFHHFDTDPESWDAPRKVAIDAQNTEVKGDLTVCCDLEAHGMVALDNTVIGKRLNTIGGRFINPGNVALSAVRTNAADVLFLPFEGEITEVDGIADFTSAHVAGNFIVGRAKFKGKASERHGFIGVGFDVGGGFIWKEVTLENGALLDLRGHVGGLCDDEQSWPAPGKLLIDGLTYNAICGELNGGQVSASPRDADSRLRWLRLQPGFFPQPYKQLGQWMRENGDEAGAVKILAAKEAVESEIDGRNAGVLPVAVKHNLIAILSLATVATLLALTGFYFLRTRPGSFERLMLPRSFQSAVQRSQHHGVQSDQSKVIVNGVHETQHLVVESRPPTADSSGENPGGQSTFKREGDFWTITYRDKTLRMKDVKGLAYIAFLLAHPGERIHVHELIARVDGAGSVVDSPSPGITEEIRAARDLGDTGVILDRQAQSEYRRRLREVDEELAEAERINDIGRAYSIRRERELLTEQLSTAAGIGGRDRKAASHIERARGMVTKNIHASLEKIRNEDAALGRFFAASIKTGYYCAYLPDPDRKISWQL